VPKVDILGDAEIIVKKNSRVDIKCRIRGTLDKPEKVNWYQNGKKVLGIIYTSEEEDADYVDPASSGHHPAPSANADASTSNNNAVRLPSSTGLNNNHHRQIQSRAAENNHKQLNGDEDRRGDENEDEEDEAKDEDDGEESTYRLTPTFVSSLIITSATLGDAGNYTCQPDDLPVAKVSLFVIRGSFFTET
jgi:hypothetical protein